MPYYKHNFDNPHFQNKKRIFDLKKLNESGLFDHLSAMKEVKVAILFGSFSRYDWYNNSDVDIFIYGNDTNFEQGKYELKLKREIQLFTAENKKDLEKMGEGLITNIVSGFIIKGSLDDMGVKVCA